MKTLECSDAGFDCKAVISGNTNEKILEQAAIHAKEVHGINVTPDLAGQMQALIKNEAR